MEIHTDVDAQKVQSTWEQSPSTFSKESYVVEKFIPGVSDLEREFILLCVLSVHACR